MIQFYKNTTTLRSLLQINNKVKRHSQGILTNEYNCHTTKSHESKRRKLWQ